MTRGNKKRLAMEGKKCKDKGHTMALEYDECYVIWRHCKYPEGPKSHGSVYDVYYTKTRAKLGKEKFKEHKIRVKITQVKELEKWYTKLMMNDTM